MGFAGAVAEDDAGQFYAVTNCFLGLCGSVMGFAIMSPLLHAGRFFPDEMQNATLAGGVALGTTVDLDMGAAVALFIGLLAGMLSTVGYAKVSPIMARFGVGDTCGVNNHHGMPG